ncbi:MAG TPA: glycosyltransferase 61 family protein [Coleofasciculaceae cyanobacterium]
MALKFWSVAVFCALARSRWGRERVSAARWWRWARQWATAGELEAVLAALEAAMIQRPSSLRLLRELLDTYALAGYRRAAWRPVQRLAAVRPALAGRAWAALGDLYWATGEWSDAMQAYDRSQQEGYQSTYLQERAARFWASRGDWHRSKWAWWTALAWEPSDRPDWQEALCFVLLADGDFEGAIKAGQAAIELGGDRAILWQRLAEANRGRGAYKQADECRRQARKLGKADPWSWLPQIGECSDRTEWQRVLLAFQRARAAEAIAFPQTAADYRQWSQWAMQARDLPLAIQALDRAMQLDPTEPEDWCTVADWLARSGQAALSTIAWQRALAAGATQPGVYYATVQAQPALALADRLDLWQAAIAHNPTDPRVYDNYGQTLEAADRPIAALAAYGQAILLAGRRLDIPFRQIGTILQRLGWWRRARWFWRWAIQLAPNSVWLQAEHQAAIARVAQAQGHWDEAIDRFMAALRYQPEFWPAYDGIQAVLEAAGLHPADPSPTSPSLFCQLPHGLAEDRCDLPPDWQQPAEEAQGVRCVTAFGAEEHELVTSQTIGEPLPELQAIGQVLAAPAAYTVELPHGRAWGDNLCSVVFNAQGRVITDCSTGYSEIVASSSHLPPPEYFAGTVAFLATRWGKVTYFHWMFDVLPRLEVLRRSGFDWESIDQFVVNLYELPFQHQSFERLNIPLEKVIACCHTEWFGSVDPVPGRIPHLTADRLLVPAIPELRIYRGARWAHQFLRDTFLEPARQQRFPDRIYITRRSAAYRHVVNDAAVVAALEALGFRAIDPAQLPLVDQAAAFAAAKVIVAVHGAGLTNLVFSQPGTKVIEIFQPSHRQNTYWLLSNLGGLEHYHLTADLAPGADQTTAVQQNIVINLDRLKAVLKLAGID